MKTNVVTQMIKLEPYAVQFRDAEGHLRNYYAFRSTGGTFFMLDVSVDNPLGSMATPSFEQVEKEKIKPVKLSSPRIFAAPKWLAAAMNEAIVNPPKPEEPVKESKKDKHKGKGAMAAAILEEQK